MQPKCALSSALEIALCLLALQVVERCISCGLAFPIAELPEHVEECDKAQYVIAILEEYITLWGVPEQVHLQNMDHLHAHDYAQNVTASLAS